MQEDVALADAAFIGDGAEHCEAGGALDLQQLTFPGCTPVMYSHSGVSFFNFVTQSKSIATRVRLDFLLCRRVGLGLGYRGGGERERERERGPAESSGGWGRRAVGQLLIKVS